MYPDYLTQLSTQRCAVMRRVACGIAARDSPSVLLSRDRWPPTILVRSRCCLHKAMCT